MLSLEIVVITTRMKSLIIITHHTYIHPRKAGKFLLRKTQPTGSRRSRKIPDADFVGCSGGWLAHNMEPAQVHVHSLWCECPELRRIRKNPATPEPGAVTAEALADSVQCSLHLQAAPAKGPGNSAATADTGEEQCTG